MNAFTQKPDLSKFQKELRQQQNKTQAAKSGVKKMTDAQRKLLYSPVVEKKDGSTT